MRQMGLYVYSKVRLHYAVCIPGLRISETFALRWMWNKQQKKNEKRRPASGLYTVCKMLLGLSHTPCFRYFSLPSPFTWSAKQMGRVFVLKRHSIMRYALLPFVEKRAMGFPRTVTFSWVLGQWRVNKPYRGWMTIDYKGVVSGLPAMRYWRQCPVANGYRTLGKLLDQLYGWP